MLVDAAKRLLRHVGGRRCFMAFFWLCLLHARTAAFSFDEGKFFPHLIFRKCDEGKLFPHPVPKTPHCLKLLTYGDLTPAYLYLQRSTVEDTPLYVLGIRIFNRRPLKILSQHIAGRTRTADRLIVCIFSRQAVEDAHGAQCQSYL